MLCRKNLVYSIWHVWAYISYKAIAFPQPSAILFVFIIVFPDRCITLALQISPKCCMYNSPSQFLFKKTLKDSLCCRHISNCFGEAWQAGTVGQCILAQSLSRISIILNSRDCFASGSRDCFVNSLSNLFAKGQS